jgi:hypothetical protein
MRVSVLGALMFALALGESQPGPVKVTQQQFRDLRWIAGTWRGSGGAYPSFFEEYKVLDDTTIKMRSFSDSTLRVPTDSSMIELRNGTVQSRSARSTYVVVAFTPSSVRFARPGAAGGGHTFARVSPDEWTATLHPAAAGGQATLYTMRRIKR